MALTVPLHQAVSDGGALKVDGVVVRLAVVRDAMTALVTGPVVAGADGGHVVEAVVGVVVPDLLAVDEELDVVARVAAVAAAAAADAGLALEVVAGEGALGSHGRGGKGAGEEGEGCCEHHFR